MNTSNKTEFLTKFYEVNKDKDIFNELFNDLLCKMGNPNYKINKNKRIPRFLGVYNYNDLPKDASSGDIVQIRIPTEKHYADGKYNTILDKDLTYKTLTVQELALGYRQSVLMKEEAYVVSVTFALQKGDKAAIKARMEELMHKRLEKQPLNYPSAGSTFKRPEGYFAGKLIEDAGLRGFRVGGAQVSEKHCGFVINEKNATAKDIYDLTNEVRDIVEDKSGVTLEREIRLLGEF